MTPSRTPLAAFLCLALLPGLASAVTLTKEEKDECKTAWPGKDKVACANAALADVEATGTMGWTDKQIGNVAIPLLKYKAGNAFPPGWNAGAAFAMPQKVRMKSASAAELNMLDWDYIFINDSFFTLATTYDAGACVLAHELAHLQLSHIKDRYAMLELPAINKWLQTSEGRPYAGKEAKEILAGYKTLRIEPVAKKQEKEADQRAFILLDNQFGNLDRQGCLALMAKLKETETPGFIDPTHPSAQERIDYLNEMDKTVAKTDRGPAVKIKIDDSATQKALADMAARYKADEDKRKADLAKICPQVGIDDKGNPVTQCPK